MAGPGHPMSLPDVVRKLAIVALLIAGVLLLHQLAIPSGDFDPRGLLALGFVVLAAYTVGELSEIVRIPHITGYLLAGLLLGESTADLLVHWVPSALQIVPLGEGILSGEVVSQLSLVDALALALIALTAGGELKFEDLRRSLLGASAAMFGMMAAVVAGVVVFLGSVHALFPQALPDFAALDRTSMLALALVIGTVGSASSPAAVIAIINSTGARGPVATNSLIGVVINQLAAAMLFTATLSIALRAVGGSGSVTVGQAAVSIGLSAGVGVLVGVGIAVYLRFVAAELILFLVGAIFATTFMVKGLNGEPAIAFIAAGIVVRNLSNTGETLIRELERLSRPVYVVFFALAGAKLHLDVLWTMLLPALGLFGTRLIGVYSGARLGARLARLPVSVERYGWTGLLSQAGLAIVLAGQLRDALPHSGEAVYSLALSMVALSELFGPVLFQAGLGAAGEIGGGARSEETPTGRAAPPAPITGAQPWPEAEVSDPWGPQSPTGGEALDEAIGALEIDLRALVQQHVEERVHEQQRKTAQWLLQLRREWLRSLRHAITRSELGEGTAGDLREEVGQLGVRWRDLAIELREMPTLVEAGAAMRLLDAVDSRALALRRDLRAGVVDAVLAPRAEPALSRLRRAVVRARQRWIPVKRTVFLRDLGRYHLSGLLPARLQPLVTVLARGELHAAAAVATLFERIAADFEEAARIAERAPPEAVHGWLVAARSRLDPEFRRISVDLEHIADAAAEEAARAVGDCLRAIRHDATVVATLDLASHRRRYNRVFADRNRGVQALAASRRHAAQLVASRREQLALELELMGLEARVRAVARQRGSELERHLRERGPVQLALVASHLEHWLQETRGLLDRRSTAGPLSRQLRLQAEPLVHRIRESRTAVGQLVAELTEEAWVTDLVNLLIERAMELSETYAVASGPLVLGASVSEPPPAAEIAFRDMVSAFVESRVARELLDVTDDLATRAREMAALLEEVERVTTFNVELSCAELDVLEDGTVVQPETVELLRAMVVGAVGRSHHRLVRVTELAELTADHTEQRVHDSVVNEFDSLRRLILAGKVAELRTLWLRDARMGQLARRAEAFGGWVPALWGRSSAVGRRALGEERIEAIRARLGLPPPIERRDRRVVFSPPEPAVDVPVVYRRLFSDLPLETGDLLAGRSAELARLRLALVPQGPVRAAAVVGVDQQSASAMASAVVRSDFAGVVRLDARGPAAAGLIDDWLARVAQVERNAVVIEGLHWLFERRPGGMAAVEQLIQGMIADRGRNAWLLVSDVSVWRFLCGATAVGDLTGPAVELAALTEEELERAVLARHGMSGYDVVFDAEEDLGWQLQHVLLRGEERERRRRHAWFRTLHLASAGVLQDALRLWMAAILEVDDGQARVRMGAVPRPPLTRLAHLPEEVQLTLLEISRQGWTDQDQHARLFRLSPDEAAAHLAGLCHLGLLVPDGEVLRIAPHLRGAVHRVLERKGWT